MGKSTDLIMIHRVIFGSIERFIGILIEHFAGQIPAVVGSRTGEAADGDGEIRTDYALKIAKQFEEAGIRAGS